MDSTKSQQKYEKEEGECDEEPKKEIIIKKKPKYQYKKQKNKSEFQQLKQMRKTEFQRRKSHIIRKFNRIKKTLLETQQKEQEYFWDRDGMIKFHEETMQHEMDALYRVNSIEEAELNARKAALTNSPYEVMLYHEKRIRYLKEWHEKENYAFEAWKFQEQLRLKRPSELSRQRRLELEQEVHINAKRDAALRRAEERAKDAELMAHLEEICGHPAEDAVKPVNGSGVE